MKKYFILFLYFSFFIVLQNESHEQISFNIKKRVLIVDTKGEIERELVTKNDIISFRIKKNLIYYIGVDNNIYSRTLDCKVEKRITNNKNFIYTNKYIELYKTIDFGLKNDIVSITSSPKNRKVKNDPNNKSIDIIALKLNPLKVIANFDEYSHSPTVSRDGLIAYGSGVDIVIFNPLKETHFELMNMFCSSNKGGNFTFLFPLKFSDNRLFFFEYRNYNEKQIAKSLNIFYLRNNSFSTITTFKKTQKIVLSTVKDISEDCKNLLIFESNKVFLMNVKTKIRLQILKGIPIIQNIQFYIK